MEARFGTDGIRGVANADLTAELVLALGRAVARVLPATAFLVGRDTRRSGPLLQAALSAGLASEGADVVDLGVLPTPGVAWVAAQRGLPAAMVSASHNPFSDNGVKVFAAGGVKLPDATEAAIEEELDRILGAPETGPRSPTGPGVGRLSSEPGAVAGYIDHLVRSIDGRRLEGVRIVLDCAHGASASVAPAVFEQLGAEAHVRAADPDGTNINDGCGSTHPDALAAEVVERGADLGLAFDGDADRLVAVDHTGRVASGDELLALFAVDLAARGQLAGKTVVVTVMTNLGFHIAMRERGIDVRQTPVGDRYVLEALNGDGLALGGEQSGHIVFPRLATTGDGTLTGVLLADLIARSAAPLSGLVAGSMERMPQLLVNVVAENPPGVVSHPKVVEAIAAVDAELGEMGRALVRPSGTEWFVRVMVEARDEVAAGKAADRLIEAVEIARADIGAMATANGSDPDDTSEVVHTV